MLPLLFRAGDCIAQLNYGLSLSSNYSMLGTRYGNYVGRGLGGFGLYLTKQLSVYHTNRVLNMFDYYIEGGTSIVGDREQNLDTRYTQYYLDLNAGLYFVPDRNSNDLRFLFGLRPSYQLYHNAEELDNGSYVIKDGLPGDRSRNGDLDFGAVVGVNAMLGDVVNVELRYCHSFTDRSSVSYTQGRPSTLEFGLKISATSLRDKVYSLDLQQKNQLERYTQGTLLVMLTTPNLYEFNMFRGPDRLLQMDEVRHDYILTNKMVIHAFRSEYTFSKVLFFYDTSAYRVAAKDFEGVFVDDNLNPISVARPDSGVYFIASFCEDVSSVSKKIDYGLFVYDARFNQMPKPYNVGSNGLGLFPQGDPANYLRKRKTLFFQEDYDRIVNKFNGRLIRYKISL